MEVLAEHVLIRLLFLPRLHVEVLVNNLMLLRRGLLLVDLNPFELEHLSGGDAQEATNSCIYKWTCTILLRQAELGQLWLFHFLTLLDFVGVKLLDHGEYLSGENDRPCSIHSAYLSLS